MYDKIHYKLKKKRKKEKKNKTCALIHFPINKHTEN